MRSVDTKSRAKDWLRLAAKLSLLFTDPKVRAAIGDHFKDRVSDITSTVADKYEDAIDRFEDAAEAFQGRNYWQSRVAGFLLGVGVGAGLGILLAPASGREIRESVRDKAIDVKNKVRLSVTNMPSTGTEG